MFQQAEQEEQDTMCELHPILSIAFWDTASVCSDPVHKGHAEDPRWERGSALTQEHDWLASMQKEFPELSHMHGSRELSACGAGMTNSLQVHKMMCVAKQDEVSQKCLDTP